MRKGRQGKYQTKYKEGPVEVKESGVGKDYPGFRIFHSRRKDEVTYIGDDYSERSPSESELARFKKDLQGAASHDKRVARYVSEFPGLMLKPDLPEPVSESIIKAG